jgi:hypothetical protein
MVPLFVAAVSCLQNYCITIDYPASVGCRDIVCYGTVAWQWLFRVYSLPHIWVLPKRWLAMDVCSASDIPAFRQHATICYIQIKQLVKNILFLVEREREL